MCELGPGVRVGLGCERVVSNAWQDLVCGFELGCGAILLGGCVWKQ